MKRRICATVIVGPNILFREGLIRILNEADFQILHAVSSVDSAFLDSLPAQESILFILDAGDDPGAVLSQITSIKARNPMWRVAVLDNDNQLTHAAAAYRAGVSAYFVNVTTPAIFVKFLELVMLGEIVLPAEFLPFLLGHEHYDENGGSHDEDAVGASGSDLKDELLASSDETPMRQLSAREKVILRCIIEGCSNKAIARKIAISEATVKVHVKSILRKVRVHSRTQAAIWGMKYGSAIWAISGNAPALARIETHAPALQHDMLPLPQPTRSESSLFKAEALLKSEPW
jgi:two-component system nitrate/nitrite response regulator NarL